MSSDSISYGNEIELQKMLISADDYQRMGEVGIFADKPRVELIDGQIYAKSPITPYHNAHVDKVSRFFTLALAKDAIIRTQGSIRTDEYSEPEPDICVLRYQEDFYLKKQATAQDTHLVIEVAIKTLLTDRSIKLKKYATAGIPEYWIIIPEKQLIEVYRNPEDEVYLEKHSYTKEEEWYFNAFDLLVKGSDLLIIS